MNTKEMLISECEKPDTAIMLSIMPEGGQNRSAAAMQASERFRQSAALLNKWEFIGMQIMADGKGENKCYTFSSRGAHITTEDYNWIFEDCMNMDQDPSVSDIGSLFDDDRKVYILSCSKERSAAGIQSKERIYDLDAYDDYENGVPNRKFKDMFDMLMNEKAVFRIIAGNTGEIGVSHCKVFISLHDNAELRIRGSIAMAFPQTTMEEVSRSSATKDSIQGISDEDLLEWIQQLLLSLSSRKAGQTVSDSEYAEDQHNIDDIINTGNDTAAYVPISSLDISVRTFHLLMRAGVDSTEKLMALSEDDMMHIRNLSRKDAEEVNQIKRKLLEKADQPEFSETSSYMTKLDSLIGLSNVKAQIKRIISFAKMKRDLCSQGRDDLSVTLNMEFVGNPGTAKTTVARITAGIMNEIGLTSSTEILEVGRADLVAEYEGQTATKVKEVFRKAKGRLLFIDEAYSLVEYYNGEFGDEAINTIVQEMENNRKNVIVVFAGYPDKMAKLFSRNPGLRSRVPFKIEFNDYSLEEMLQIADSEARKRGFIISNEAFEKMSGICSSIIGHPETGNGRFCRNLIENAILEYASRVYDGNNSIAKNDFVLSSDDFIPVNNPESAPRLPIGFHS